MSNQSVIETLKERLATYKAERSEHIYAANCLEIEIAGVEQAIREQRYNALYPELQTCSGQRGIMTTELKEAYPDDLSHTVVGQDFWFISFTERYAVIHLDEVSQNELGYRHVTAYELYNNEFVADEYWHLFQTALDAGKS